MPLNIKIQILNETTVIQYSNDINFFLQEESSHRMSWWMADGRFVWLRSWLLIWCENVKMRMLVSCMNSHAVTW